MKPAIRLALWTFTGMHLLGVATLAQKGVVVNDADGKPIANALVMQKPSWALVLTNAKGEFDFGPANPVRVNRSRTLRHGLRLMPGGRLQLLPSLLGEGKKWNGVGHSIDKAIRAITLQGRVFNLPISVDGVVKLPAQLQAEHLIFLQVGKVTLRMMQFGQKGGSVLSAGISVVRDGADVEDNSNAPLSKKSADPDTLIVSRYGFDAKTQLISGNDQGTLRLKANAKAPPPGMKELKGATYMMGSRRNPVASPEHEVTVSGFYVDTVEVTQDDYKLLMGDEFTKRDPYGYDLNFGPQYSAMNMTWYEAVLYCNARSKRDGLDTVFTYKGRTPKPEDDSFILDSLKVDIHAKGYRLATEAEWEYSCKGGQDSDYFWGTNKEIKDSANVYAWWGGNLIRSIENGTLTNQKVAKKKMNAFGLYDIVGNSAEYILDSRLEPYPTSPNIDPYFESSEKPPSRTDKGGGWSLPVNSHTCTARGSIFPYIHVPISGFRAVLPIR
jgi:formylglycine-generating enzyme required for sulfatase activity